MYSNECILLFFTIIPQGDPTLLGLVWEPQTRRGLEGLKSPPYSILNKKGILTT
jgi:hypothetical protein